jgi:Tol biopolymer transport system component
VLATSFSVAFVPLSTGETGAILFQREGTLLAQLFHLRSLTTVGEPRPLVEHLGSYLSFGNFAASDKRTLVYRGAGGGSQMTWFDRKGKSVGSVGAPHDYMGMVRLSPDGTRIAAGRSDHSNRRDIWLTSIPSDRESRFTVAPASNNFPVWSPDGSRIGFSSNKVGWYDLYEHSSNGAGKDELLFRSDHHKHVTDWSRDGRYLLYDDTDSKTKRDLWVLPMEAGLNDRKPIVFSRTEFDEMNGRFSPNTRWVAYESDVTGRVEVYVRQFQVTKGGDGSAGGEWMVSRGGGSLPVWRGDGKELFYLSPDGNVMAVAIQESADALQHGTPTALFKNPMIRQGLGWDATPDGNRFLLLIPASESAQAPFTVLENWTSLLKQ